VAKLIAIEGIDGSGKSTQITNVAKNLMSLGYKVASIKFYDPNSSIGQAISEMLKDKNKEPRVLQLLLEADRFAQQKKLKMLLGSHDYVLCDRYSVSGLAYGMAEGLSAEWILSMQIGQLDAFTILLDISPNEAIERKGISATTLYDTDLEFLQKVRANYLSIVDQRYWVDGTGAKVVVCERILDLIFSLDNNGE
jgi:dTMP kinase